MSEAGLTVRQWVGHKGGCGAQRRRLQRRLAGLLAEMEVRSTADAACRERAQQLAGRLRTVGGYAYSWQNILVLLAQAEERGVTLTPLASAGAWYERGRVVRKRARPFLVFGALSSLHGSDRYSEGEHEGQYHPFPFANAVQVFDEAQTEEILARAPQAEHACSGER